MSDEIEEQKVSPDTIEVEIESVLKSPEAALKNEPKTLEEELGKDTPEVEKGMKIVIEERERYKQDLKNHGADDENLQEFIENQEVIERELNIVEGQYKGDIEVIQKDIPNFEDKAEQIKKDIEIKDKNELKMGEKEINFIKSLEDQGLLGEEINVEYLKIKSDYKIKLINKNKNPKEGETWDELIMEEMDKNYAEFIKTKVGERDQKIIDIFQETDDEKTMPLKYRQELLNTLFKNPNKLYADKNGEMVSLQDYLKEYYKDIGVSVEIKFKTIDPDIKKSLAGNLLRDEFSFMGLDNNASQEKSYQEVEEGNEKISYILNDEIAIPHLIVERENIRKEIPLIAGSRDLHMPLRREKRNEAGERERKGHFVQSQVVHAPKTACNIQKIISFNIHEIDHAIKEIMPTKNQNELDQRLISEGTAEKASINFMDTQHKYLKDNPAIKKFDGYDYQANLQQVLGRSAVNKKSSNNKDHRYAQGYTLTKGYEVREGEEKYKKLFYTGELDINKELGDVVKIREKIDEQFITQNEMCKKIMLGKLDEDK